MTNALFDGHANKYDTWFMENSHVFLSELNLLKISLGNISNQRILSMGCGSGLFEHALKEQYDIIVQEGVEPSQDMAEIARQRGMDVTIATAESFNYSPQAYDIIYFNGSSSYIQNLLPVYQRAFDGLKPGGKLILLDVPKDSNYGSVYLLAKALGTYNHKYLDGIAPAIPYPLELVNNGVWHTNQEKIDILKQIGMSDIQTYQTLINNPVFSNDSVEPTIEGYKQGGYVAIIAEK